MRNRILKWKRDRAVARLTHNSEQMEWTRASLVAYCETVPAEERNPYFLNSMMVEVERLRQQIEDDKDFIRTTAQEATT
jgi:hypothetical protein